jgi:predicted Rossmann-fold nucleotide-binding protein
LLEGADAIVALPGGLGTLDELLEAAALKQLGMLAVSV